MFPTMQKLYDAISHTTNRLCVSISKHKQKCWKRKQQAYAIRERAEETKQTDKQCCHAYRNFTRSSEIYFHSSEILLFYEHKFAAKIGKICRRIAEKCNLAQKSVAAMLTSDKS